MDELDVFFDPRNVAVIGASRDADKIGHSVMRNFVENRFFGDIYPVNPNAEEIMGYDAVAAVDDIDDAVDLAVVCVPADIANDVIADCVENGVGGVIVITSGYREIGGDGEQRSAELQDIIANGDTRVIGPNCLGVWDAYSGVDTLFLPSYKLTRPPQGDIAIITQSGSFGSAVLDQLAAMDVGVSRFISYGNQIDVTEIELLQWLAQDEKTDAVAAYLEGVSDGRRFLDAMEHVTDDLPVIALKAGKHDAGRNAVSSHTGSLAGSYQVYRGVFTQRRVIEAETIEELFDATRALAYNQPLQGEDVAVVTNGGGFGVLAADALERHGLSLADFSEETGSVLRDVVPAYGTVQNPLDVVGDADAERFETALRAVVDDDWVDGVIAIPLLQPLPMDSDIVDVLANVQEESDTPLLACLAGSEYTQLHMENLEQNNVAAYPSPERAADAMYALHRYGQWH